MLYDGLKEYIPVVVIISIYPFNNVSLFGYLSSGNDSIIQLSDNILLGKLINNK